MTRTHGGGREAVAGLPVHRRPPELELRPRRQRRPGNNPHPQHQSQSAASCKMITSWVRSLFLLLALLLNGSRGRRGGGGGADARGGPPAGDHGARAARLPAGSRGAGAAEAGAGGERGHGSDRRSCLQQLAKTVAACSGRLGQRWRRRHRSRPPAGVNRGGWIDGCGWTCVVGRRRQRKGVCPEWMMPRCPLATKARAHLLDLF